MKSEEPISRISGEADLRDDQHVAHPGAPLTGRAAAALAKALLQAGARRLQGRHDPEDDARADRDRHGVGERANVEAPVNEVGNAVGRDRAVEQLQTSPGDDDAERRAEEPDHDRLGQQLPDDAEAPRAESGADGDFAVADRGAGEQQVRDVRTGDQQHQRHRAHHHEHDQLRLIRQHPVADRADQHGPVAVHRIRRRQAPGDAVDVRRHLVDRDAGLQAREQLHAAVVARGLLAVFGERHPETLLFRKGKFRRHHADDRVRAAVDADRAPHHAGIAVVARIPDLVAEHHHGLGARTIVLRTEVAAEDRRLSDQLEEVPGDRRAVVALRLGRTVGDRQAAAAERRQRRRGRVLVAQVLVVRVRDAGRG